MEQDSTKIINAADALDGYTGDAGAAGTGSFMGLVNEFYDKINEKFIAEGTTEGGFGTACWGGPRCAAFLKNAEAKRATFNSAAANFKSLATNLREQGQAWASFEGEGGAE